MTPIQEQIEIIEKLKKPIETGDNYQVGYNSACNEIVAHLQSLLPKEKEAIEQACLSGMKNILVWDNISTLSQIKYRKDAKDYFETTYINSNP